MPDAQTLVAEDLFEMAGLKATGPVAWGTVPPASGSGVYAVSIEPGAIDLCNLDEALQGRWIPNQAIVYIGRAKALKKRVRQFYRHKYGKTSPHRGGQSILLLKSPLLVYWAETTDYALAEDRLIEAFRARCGKIPFGNRVKSARMALAQVSSGQR